MKLTTEQITKIDEVLIEKGLIYEDIKLEVTDHIASEIESKLENNPSNFEIVFKEVFTNWEEELKLTSNWSHSSFVAPKIVIEKYFEQLKKVYKFAALYDLLFSLLMVTVTRIYPQEITYTVCKIFFITCYSLSSLMLLYCLFANWKLKSTTIFGKIFRGQFLASILFLINYTFNSGDHLYRHYFEDSIASQFIQWFVHGFFMFIGVYLIPLAFAHFITMRKYKLS